ncbi:MAG: phenylalanine--tRNA ligase subunit alpha [Chloroflexi bacterium]|nr:phenylalanine--tRNA ligase subunit alpha [Chloroflexota bacterium]
MADLIATIEASREQAEKTLRAASDLKQLESWRIANLGKKSPVMEALRGLSSLGLDAKKKAGAAANEAKSYLESAYKARLEQLKGEDLEKATASEAVDVTLPGQPVTTGRLHPTTQAVNEVCRVFAGMGFEVIEGPEVESEYYNFEALNIPRDHPARDMWATLWVEQTVRGDQRALLRTHTSPMQIRAMETRKPPVRVVVPGKVYRYEATDATHEWMFHQVEGLAIDTNITFSDLKGTLFEFARRLFGADRKARFRCDYFPFVEPGVEMAIDCFVCRGAGCRLCKSSGWIEILGAGMVHPDVLRRMGCDPKVYSGFAFGMGVERIPMLRYGIEDIRHFYANDLRFLKRF